MTQAAPSVEINEDKMHAFSGKVVGDLGASLSSVLAYIGQKLGLYAAISGFRRMTPPNWPQKRIPTNVTFASG